MKTLVVFLLLCSCGNAALASGECEIAAITPQFNPETPGFGAFTIKVEIINHSQRPLKIPVTCLYTGLTAPGVYFKNEPDVQKQYKMLEIGPAETAVLVFDERFGTYHPCTVGEIIISLAGTGIIRSLPLRTAFHPDSQD